MVRDPARIEAFVTSVSDAPFLALDTETSGLDPHTDRLLLIQFGTADRQILIDAQAVSASDLAPIFRRDRPVVMHNASFDLKMLEANFGEGLALEEALIADTQAAERLLRNGRKSDVVLQGWSLKLLAERYAGMELDKSIRQGFYGIQSINDLSEAELYYAARDVEATYKIFAEQLPQLEREHLLRVAAIEGAAQIAFAQLELTGAPIDTEAWKRTLATAVSGSADARKRLDREFWSVADRDLFGGTTLNYDSDAEVLDALSKLGVSLTTTRREVLVATGHPAAQALAEYREHHKLVSTYGEAFLAHVHPKTGRIHARFKAIGATTGRSSCAEPNLQNIPAGSEFRACFAAPEGRRLVTADYQGAELRIIADASGDPVFVRTLCAGGDLHAIVASRLFGRAVTKESHPELRARAKAINFGLAYGMGVGGLAKQLDVSEQQAGGLLERYFAAFPEVQRYLDGAARKALSNGVAATRAGRRYWFIDLRRDGRDAGTLTRVAKNMPIQGTNADIIKIAMSRIVRAFRQNKIDGQLVNMIHDELVVEVAEADAERARDVMVQEMMSAGAELVKKVPMTVDAQIGTTWSK